MYSCVVIDPPWLERGAGKVKRGADRHYALMHTPEIVDLLKREIAPQLAPDCHLWLWVTNNFLPDGLLVIRELGFRYVTNLAWVKDRIGLGQYLRGQHELLLFAVRGEAMMPEHRTTPSVVFCPECQSLTDSVVFCSKGQHSQKPQLVYDSIANVSPAPRPEVFCRTKRPGWDAWGNEVEDTLLTLGESA